ncbi:MAG TPA: hypothetical protein VFE23_15800 [Usitatibacter sp.]|jgi:hypothetical protein|nr:hypothetical protein [Usitatibacter sp.]
MKYLRFEKLYLLSEAERKARRFNWSPKANALIGSNHVGKSTVIRSLFETFGCKTSPLGNEWNPRAIASAVAFSVGETRFEIMRWNGSYGLFDRNRNLLWVTAEAGKLRDYLSELFGFVLPLTPNNSAAEPRQARPAMFFVPFFVDQDGSWDSSWRTFGGLGEFKQWQKPAIELALGIRPSEYWQTASDLARERKSLDEAARDQRVLDDAKRRLAERFPRGPWFRDALSFRRDLKALEERASHLAREQEATRGACTDAIAARDNFQAEARLIESALNEHASDMQFLDTQPTDEPILCPTCGTPHEHSFHERLNLEAEADELRQLRESLLRRIDSVNREYAREREKLDKLDEQAKEIERILDTRRGDIKLRDVVQRAGIETAHGAFEDQQQALNERRGQLLRAIQDLETKLALYDNKERARDIREMFNRLYARFAQALDVPPSLLQRRGEIAVKPQQGGSGGPRAVLAYYFAMSHTASQFSWGTIPPLVVDSPHQKAQDEINRPIVTEFIFKYRPEEQQLIVGLEEPRPDSAPLGDLDKEYFLTKKYELLEAEEFEEVQNALRPLARAMRESERGSW